MWDWKESFWIVVQLVVFLLLSTWSCINLNLGLAKSFYLLVARVGHFLFPQKWSKRSGEVSTHQQHWFTVFRSASTFSIGYVWNWVTYINEILQLIASISISLRGIFWLYANGDCKSSSLVDLFDLSALFKYIT